MTKYQIFGYGKEETEHQWQKLKKDFIIELEDNIDPYLQIQSIFSQSLKNWLITINKIEE